MKISIVTVCYNSAATIGQTLRSVAMQTHPDVEHLVIDSASTDSTLDIVAREGAHIARLVSEPDRGIYDAMNKGLALATGDIVAYLNSDDRYADSAVLSEVAAAALDPSVSFVYGDISMVNAQGTVVRTWKTGAAAAQHLDGRQIPHPAFFVRRRALQQIQPAFDSTMRIAADLKQQLILINKMGARGAYLPRTLVLMSMGGASTSSFRSYVVGWRESVRAYDDVFSRGGVWYTVRKVLSKVSGLRKLS